MNGIMQESENALQTADEQKAHQLAEAGQIMGVIERVASNPEADIEKLERLMDMHYRVVDRQAKNAFFSAFAELMSEMPVIEKNKGIVVKGTVRSTYATYDALMTAVREPMHQHGFAISFRTNTGGGLVSVSGILMHKAGHSEETCFSIPPDQSGAKSNIQAVGSSLSYAKRYVLTSLLNIATGDVDTDCPADVGELAAAINDIYACDNLQALKSTFGAAWNSFKEQGDRQRLITAKDEMKGKLK